MVLHMVLLIIWNFLSLYVQIVLRIIILIAVGVLKPGTEVNRALGQPTQLELVCVPVGGEAPVPRNPRNGPPGPGGQGGGAGGAGGNRPGGHGGNQGGGYRGGNSANNQQQQQGYRSGELHRSYLTTDLCTYIVTRVVCTLFQVVLLCMELAPMDLTWVGDLLSTSMLLGDDA